MAYLFHILRPKKPDTIMITYY